MRACVKASAAQAEGQLRLARRTRRLVMGGLSGLTALSLVGGAPIFTGQGEVWNLVRLRNGALISGGSDGSLRLFLMPSQAIREARQEIKGHAVLLTPQTPVERAARRTRHTYGALKE